MSTLQNDVFLRALAREQTEYTPIWIMRQAGRYLPEYRATRARAGSFMDLCRNAELACEVTLQPLERFALDAAILFSDILTVPDAMGLGLHFVEGEGPRFERPLRDEKDILALPVPDPCDSLRYVMDAVTTIRKALGGRVPLIGFSGSPWTLACYMVEGRSSSDYRAIKTLAYSRPDLLEHILEITTQAVIAYLQAQIEAGAQAIMLFDSWGGVLSHSAFERFSLPWMQRIVSALPREREGRRVPCVVFTKGGGLWLEALAGTGADAVGLDWTMDIGLARQRTGGRVALQGNLDPAVLFGSAETIGAEARAILDAFGNHPGHVFNLGHGISQYTSPEAVAVLVDTVHEYSRQLRAQG